MGANDDAKYLTSSSTTEFLTGAGDPAVLVTVNAGYLPFGLADTLGAPGAARRQSHQNIYSPTDR